MSDPAIKIAGLSKSFRIWRHPSDMLKEVLTGRQRHTEFQALHDVTFDVPRGSVVGLMGRNGAGKSTLLRIVAGTLDASGGSVLVKGRISAILELGTGFHQDYTGRENIFLGGMCLGLSRAEITQRYDEIVAFSELAEFIDQPFRTYSSGMQARLTFAVATAVDPDILIIDEALGVGDARFQLKSFDRIRKFRDSGKTILLVSHNINQIVSICDHAILLERGRILTEGDPNRVGNIYHELLFGPAQSKQSVRGGGRAQDSKDIRQAGQPPESGNAAGYAKPASEEEVPQFPETPPINSGVGERRYGIGGAVIHRAWFELPDGKEVTVLESLKRYRLAIRILATRDVVPIVTGFLIRDQRGFEIFGWDGLVSKTGTIPAMRGGQSLTSRLQFDCNLASGHYFLTLALAEPDGTKHDMHFDAMAFQVSGSADIHTSSLVNLGVTVVQEPATVSDNSA